MRAVCLCQFALDTWQEHRPTSRACLLRRLRGQSLSVLDEPCFHQVFLSPCYLLEGWDGRELVAHVIAEGTNVCRGWPWMHGRCSAQLRPNVFVGDFGYGFRLRWMCHVNIWSSIVCRGCVRHLEDLLACCCCCALACLFGRLEVENS